MSTDAQPGGEQWSLPPDYEIQKVTTALSETVDYSLGKLGVKAVWGDSEGEGVTIAVLDTGCFPHPDLDGAIVAAKDFTGSPMGASDFVGHGTWCAGMIAARANGVGVIGIAPKCKLLIAKVLNDSGSGRADWIAAGIDWALENGADILSLSLGGPDLGPQARASYRRFVAANGRSIFAAAGNAGNPLEVDFPARWEESICVGAVDKDGIPTRYSNKGPRVDIWTYGSEMLSTIPRGYGTMTGTSMATPQAAGVAALAVSYARKKGVGIANYEAIRKLMRDTAKDGIIVPAEIIKLIGTPPKAKRRKLLDLGVLQIYAGGDTADDAGVVFQDDIAKASFLAQVASIIPAQVQ
jgi:subtilisin